MHVHSTATTLVGDAMLCCWLNRQYRRRHNTDIEIRYLRVGDCELAPLDTPKEFIDPPGFPILLGAVRRNRSRDRTSGAKKRDFYLHSVVRSENEAVRSPLPL